MNEEIEYNIDVLNYIIKKTKENIQSLEKQRLLYHDVKQGIAMTKGISRLLADLRKDLRMKIKLERGENKKDDNSKSQQ